MCTTAAKHWTPSDFKMQLTAFLKPNDNLKNTRKANNLSYGQKHF